MSSSQVNSVRMNNLNYCKKLGGKFWVRSLWNRCNRHSLLNSSGDIGKEISTLFRVYCICCLGSLCYAIKNTSVIYFLSRKMNYFWNAINYKECRDRLITLWKQQKRNTTLINDVFVCPTSSRKVPKEDSIPEYFMRFYLIPCTCYSNRSSDFGKFFMSSVRCFHNISSSILNLVLSAIRSPLTYISAVYRPKAGHFATN